jgi:hypothetical protein
MRHVFHVRYRDVRPQSRSRFQAHAFATRACAAPPVAQTSRSQFKLLGSGTVPCSIRRYGPRSVFSSSLAAHLHYFQAVPQFGGGILSTFYTNYFRSTSMSIANHHVESGTGQGWMDSSSPRESSRLLVLAKRHALRFRVGGCGAKRQS